MLRKLTVFGVALILCGLATAKAAEQTASSAPSKQAGTTAPSVELLRPDKLKEDLDFLFKTIKEVHPNMYAYISKAEFAKRRNALYRRVNRPMTRIDFYKLVAPVVASLKNGHTLVVPPLYQDFKKGAGKWFPVKFACDGPRPILAAYYGPGKVPIGGTILSINGKDASTVIARFAKCVPTECRDSEPRRVERLLPLFLRLEYGASKGLNLRIRAIGGTVSSHVIKPISQKEFRADNAKASKKTIAYSYRHIPERNVGLIELNSFRDREKFKGFLRKTFKELRDKKVSNLIIDIRGCPGGNSSVGDALLDYLTDKPFRQFEKAQAKISSQVLKKHRQRLRVWISHPEPKIGSIITLKLPLRQPKDNPLRFKGRTYVLIGFRSYSSAVSFASAVKCYHISTLVGEETGDTTTAYGDVIFFKLPHSSLKLGVAFKYFIQAGSKDDGRGVIPDYEVKQKPKDLTKGIDSVLEFTLDLIKKEQASSK